jgi:hypothetical protein
VAFARLSPDCSPADHIDGGKPSVVERVDEQKETR